MPPPNEAPSPVPAWRKLIIHEGYDVLLVGAPNDFEISPLPSGVRVSRLARPSSSRAHVDVALAFHRHASELDRSFASLAPRVFPNGGLWALWPRKAAGHESDLGDEVVRHCGLSAGLVDVKVAVVSPDWSGLRFVWRATDRS